MMPNVLPSKMFPNLGAIAPQSLSSAAANTGGTYLLVPPGAKWLIANILVGAGAGSVALTANQAKTSGGGSSKAMTLTDASGGALTGLLTAGTVVKREFNVDTHFDVAGGFFYVQFVLTTTGTLIVGLDLSSGPNNYAD